MNNQQRGGGRGGGGQKQPQYSVHVVGLTGSGNQRTMTVQVLKNNRPLPQGEAMRVRFELNRSPQASVDADVNAEASYTFTVPIDKPQVTLSAVLIAQREPRTDQTVELGGVAVSPAGLSLELRAKLGAVWDQLEMQTSGTRQFLETLTRRLGGLDPVVEQPAIFEMLAGMDTKKAANLLEMWGDPPPSRYFLNDEAWRDSVLTSGFISPLTANELSKFRGIMTTLENEPNGAAMAGTIDLWLGRRAKREREIFQKRIAVMPAGQAVTLLVAIANQGSSAKMTAMAKARGLLL